MLHLAHVVHTAFTLSAAALSELQHQHYTVVRDFVPPAVVSTLVNDVALLHAQAQHPQAHSMRLPLPCRAAPSPLPCAPLLAHAVRRPPHSPQAHPTAVPVPAAFACPCRVCRQDCTVQQCVRGTCSAHAEHTVQCACSAHAEDLHWLHAQDCFTVGDQEDQEDNYRRCEQCYLYPEAAAAMLTGYGALSKAQPPASSNAAQEARLAEAGRT